MAAHLRIRNELQAAVDLASGLMAKAEAETRELSAEERAQVDAQLAKARDLRAQLTRAQDVAALQDELKAFIADNTKDGSGNGGAAPASTALAVRRGSLGAQIVASDLFEFVRAGHARGGAWTSPSVDLMAATLTEDPASGGKLLVPTYAPGIYGLPFAPPTVIDLIAQGTTDAASIVYMIEKTATNAAAPVAEGQPKPESALTFDSVTDAVKKIATWLPISEEMLADAAQIESYVNNRLSQFVALALENQIINGDGLGPNLLGITNRPGLAPDVVRGTTELNAMAIYRQIVEIMATAMLMPDGVVMSPRAWGSTVSAQNAQGVFYGPGMFAGIPSPSLWGLPVALSTNLAQAEALVGAFKQGAQLWRRSAITVQASNSHADYFIRNLVAIRAEQRAALAVYRPGAFGLVTGLETLTAPVGTRSGEAPAIGSGGAAGQLPPADRERNGGTATQLPADRERNRR
jgi:HK97 family phage major capsid protein